VSIITQKPGAQTPDENGEQECQIAEFRPDVELQTLIDLADRNRRSVKRFRGEALTLSTLDQDIAIECLYSVPRAGKTIEGPSVRFAEILAHTWRNCRVSSTVVDIGFEYVTARGTFIDLEKNSGIQCDVKRRIVGKTGNRYGDDMIQTTANAACAIARRNAVFAGIPRAFWQSLYNETRACAIGDAKTLVNRRAEMFDRFAKMSVTEAMVLEFLERPSVEDVQLDDLAKAFGAFSAIRNNEATVDEVFAPKAALPPKKTPTEAMREKGAKKQAETKPAPPAGPNGPMAPEDEAEILRREREGN
jgi:hypothetical protein